MKKAGIEPPDGAAASVAGASVVTDDPVWRMPLHGEYNYMIDSKVADVVNSAPSPYAGAVTAALFLQPVRRPHMRTRVIRGALPMRPGEPVRLQQGPAGLSKFAFVYDQPRTVASSVGTGAEGAAGGGPCAEGFACGRSHSVCPVMMFEKYCCPVCGSTTDSQPGGSGGPTGAAYCW